MPKAKPNPLHCVDAFTHHFQALVARYQRVLEANGLDMLAIHAGQTKRHFLDDSEYSFRVNPQFKALCPLSQAPHSWVLVRAGAVKPTLVLFAPEDFWHEPLVIDQEDWLGMFHVELIATPSDIERHIPYDKAAVAYLGEHIEVAQALGIVNVNPEAVVQFLHYHRLFKSEYEVSCIRAANQIAIAGHEAAEAAFYNGQSEFDCWLAYMQATRQGPDETPYPHIIAHNENAAILHYRGKLKQSAGPRSMMIDAGAQYRGYAADISRTYSFESGPFAQLIQEVDSLCRSLVGAIRPNATYASLHEQAHYGIADMLNAFGWVSLDKDSMIDEGITQAFMPHSFGHMLGLQVHDVAGNMEDPSGKLSAPPERFAKLKTNRKIEPRHVLTVEPGLYFIDALLQPFSQGPLARYFDWQAIEQMRPYGGVRVEDNILVTERGAVNLTRQEGLS